MQSKRSKINAPASIPSSTTSTIQEVVKSLHVVCQQEISYAKNEWLQVSPEFQTNGRQQQQQHHKEPNHTEPDRTIDSTCRSMMIQWYSKLIHRFDMNHETIEIAVSYLDRFMFAVGMNANSSNGIGKYIYRNEFQLASITCLYLAIKIHEPVCMDLEMMASLSNKKFTILQLEQMEHTILASLDWRMNPPTTSSFLQLFLQLIQASEKDMSLQEYESILRIATLQTEYHVSDDILSMTKGSVVSYCSIMNALEFCANSSTISRIGHIGYYLAESIGITNCNDPTIIRIQDRLYCNCLEEQQPQHALKNVSIKIAETKDFSSLLNEQPQSSAKQALRRPDLELTGSQPYTRGMYYHSDDENLEDDAYHCNMANQLARGQFLGKSPRIFYESHMHLHPVCC